MKGKLLSIGNGIPTCLFLLSLLMFAQNQLFAQEKTKIRIINANSLTGINKKGRQYKKLVGEVRLRQKDILMECDSALFFDNENRVNAYGRVRIFRQTDFSIAADSLRYNGNDGHALLMGNVVLRDSTMQLRTNRLDYYLHSKTAYYQTGAELKDAESLLVSKRGSYNDLTGIAVFKDSVRLNNPEYFLEADSLIYATREKTARFTGRTIIRMKDGVIHCTAGRYSTATGDAVFGEHTTMFSGSYTLQTDSMILYKSSGKAYLFKQFIWQDTLKEVTVIGSRAEYQPSSDYFTAPLRPLLIYKTGGDSLFLSADTLSSYFDSVDGVRKFDAWYDVRIYKDDLQGICDSLHFSYKDSTFKMLYNPVLWSEASQITGDTILVTLKNNRISRMLILNNGFIASKHSKDVFDQIKGRTITGYFKSGQLSKLFVEGNSESIYYGTDNRGYYSGVNKAVSSAIKIDFEAGKAKKITLLEHPEAVFSPMQKINPGEYILEGFRWLQEKRPDSLEDLNTPYWQRAWKSKS